jgi:1-phosphatidylinositol-3-phosphate 5-kinase
MRPGGYDWYVILSWLLSSMQAWYSRWLGSMFTTGSYTFAKTLEYKAKQGLSSGKEFKVIPPIEYQERFVKALDGYFVACPGVSIVSMTIMSV